MTPYKLTSNEIESANRAEATAILIRAGYRVYRPEADVSGEDLVIRTPEGQLRSVQMKARPVVELRRYGGHEIWMLFPDPAGRRPGRPWFLIEHDEFFEWVKARHGHTAGWTDAWSFPRINTELRNFLQAFKVQSAELDMESVE